MNELTITLRLAVPDGVTLLDVDAAIQPVTRADSKSGTAPATGVARRIEAAPSEYHGVLRDFAEGCENLGCRVGVPDGKREDYLNVYSPNGRRSRVASFMVRESTQMRGPRVEIYCNPSHVASHPPAEPDLHNGVPVQVKIYLGDDGAIAAALALITVAIGERRQGA